MIDSLNLSTGVGLLVLRAAELRDQGLSAEQIENALLNSVSKVHTSFVIDTMEYLYQGGRCTALQAVAGSVLKIHPIIGVHLMLDDFESHLPELDRGRVFVTTTNDCEEDVQFLVNEVKWIAAPENVRVTKAGSVISSHCGPGTAGILYFVK